MEQNKKPKKASYIVVAWGGLFVLFHKVAGYKYQKERSRESNPTRLQMQQHRLQTVPQTTHAQTQRCFATEGSRATKAAQSTAPDEPVPTEWF